MRLSQNHDLELHQMVVFDKIELEFQYYVGIDYFCLLTHLMISLVPLDVANVLAHLYEMVAMNCYVNANGMAVEEQLFLHYLMMNLQLTIDQQLDEIQLMMYLRH